MTDPRYDDPNDRNARFQDPVVRRDRNVDRMWGWIAGIAVVVLIAFILIAGWNSGDRSASNTPNPTAPSSSPLSPPATTGSGAGLPAHPGPPAR